jgi:DNA-binding NarL/FixJ family response regulator
MPEIKIIILTASDDDEALSEAVKSGAEGYLSKVFGAEKFLTLLSMVT